MASLLDFSLVEHNPYKYVKDNHENNLTFVIHRNKNKNVVVYAGNVTDGVLKKEDPLNVYWIMFEKSGYPTEGLNVIERNSAYGVSVSPWEGRDGHFKAVLTSLKDRVLDLHVKDGKSVATVTISGAENCRLERVFVQSTSSWGIPKVEYVELRGLSPAGKEVEEKVIPK